MERSQKDGKQIHSVLPSSALINLALMSFPPVPSIYPAKLPSGQVVEKLEISVETIVRVFIGVGRTRS